MTAGVVTRAISGATGTNAIDSESATPAGLPPLIDRLYDAALAPAGWRGLSQMIAKTFDANGAVIKLHGPGQRIEMVDNTANLDTPDRLRDWSDHWHANDLWVERSVSHGMSRIVVSQALVSADEASRSAFYQERLPPLDIHHMAGAVFALDQGGVGVIGIHRARSQTAFDAADQRALRALLPHLQRAMKLAQRMATTPLASAPLAQCLDMVDDGLALIASDRRVVHLNRTAEVMLNQACGLRLMRGRIVAEPPGAAARIERALAAALDPVGAAVTAPAAVLVERGDRSPLTLTATPIGSMATMPFGARPMAMLTIRDPEWPPLAITRLQELFGLRRSEAIVAAQLGCGLAPHEIARACGIGIATVRSHVKQLYQKTGTSRQAQLAVLLARSSARLVPLPNIGDESIATRR